jgi:2,4-dienoyl-CoA reductase (NADPH2)
VVLVDSAPEAGGAVRDLVRAPLLAAWEPLLRQLQGAAAGVEFRPRTVATPALLAELGAQTVVWAAGSAPAPAGFPSDVPMLSTVDLLAGLRPPADVPVVVVGGPETDLEPFIAADLLCSQGWPVVLLSQRRDLGSTVDPRTLNALLERLCERGVELRPMTRAVAFANGVLRTELVYGARPGTLEAGAVVLAQGRVAVAAPQLPVATYVIGDALAPRRLTHAMLEGTRFGAAL